MNMGNSINRSILVLLMLMTSSCAYQVEDKGGCEFHASIVPLHSKQIYGIDINKNSSDHYNIWFVAKSRQGLVLNKINKIVSNENTKKFCENITKEGNRSVRGGDRKILIDYPSISYTINYNGSMRHFDSDASDQDSLVVDEVNNEIRKFLAEIFDDGTVPSQIDWSDL